MSESQWPVSLSPDDARQHDRLCDQFEHEWRIGRQPDLDRYINAVTEPGRSELLRELLLLDIDYRRRLGRPPERNDYHIRFPDDTALIDDVWQESSDISPSTFVAADSGNTVDSPCSGPPGPSPPAAFAADRYELMHEVGHGGIGIVFRGHDRILGRDLAVKVLRETYWDKPEAQRRFAQEARIGSRLQHPAIVPVYEMGQFDDRRSYFTMKLVEGRTLAELLKDRASPSADLPHMLGIFEQVCQAMAYAHSRGVVHRDLKPANIMVGAFGEVQVMDWGFAKTLDDESATLGDEFRRHGSSTNNSSPSLSGALMGTPAYMPPEQARGEVRLIDRRTDVFALGAILVEILSGRPPYIGRSADDVCRDAAEGRLEAAMIRLDQSGTDIALRNLAKKCLVAEQDNRPSHAGILAAELQTYLASSQERARQAQLAQAAAEARVAAERRARRWTLAFSGALLFGAGLATWLAFVAFRAQRDAEASALAESKAKETAQAKESEAQSVFTFFRDRVLEAARPKGEEGGLGRDATIRDALDKAVPEIARTFTGQRAAEASIRHTIGLSLFYSGNPQAALQQSEQALAIRHEVLGPEHSETLATMCLTGMILHAVGRYEDASKILTDCLQIRRRVSGDENSETITAMHNLANSLRVLRRYDESRKLFEETLQLQRRVLGPEHRHTLYTINALAVLSLAEGKLEEARKQFEQAVQLRKRVLGPEHPSTLVSMNGLAFALDCLDKADEARTMYEETLEIQRRVIGPEHQDTLRTMSNLARLYYDHERVDEATKLYRETFDGQRRVLGPEHPDTLRSMNGLAVALDSQRQFEEATRLYAECFEIRRRVSGPEHLLTLYAMYNLANVWASQGRWEEARNLHEETIPLKKRSMGPTHIETLRSMNALAWLLLMADDPKFRDPPRALELAKEVVQHAPDSGHKWSTLGAAYYRLGRWNDAIAVLEKADALGPESHTAHVAFFLAMAYWQAGDQQKASQWNDTGVERAAKYKPGDPELDRVRSEAAQVLGISNSKPP